MKKIARVNELNHEQWLEVRKVGIGGSDAGAVLGVSPYKSSLELFLEKTNRKGHGETTEAMRLGTDMEQIVANRFMEATGKKVTKSNFMYCHDDYPYMIANIDRMVVGERAFLECKTMNPNSKYDVEIGEIPPQYMAQIQHYMAVLGYEYCYIAFIVFQRGFYWHKIYADKEYQARLIEAEKEFWGKVKDDIPPEADGSDSSLDALNILYPEGNGNMVPIPDFKIERLREINDMEKHLKEEKDILKAEICQALGSNEIGMGDKYSCSWKNQNRTSVDTDKLKMEYPEIYASCLKVTSSRVFRTKVNKGAR